MTPRPSITLPDHFTDATPSLPMNVLQQIRRIVRAAQRHSQLLEKSTGLPGAQLWALQEVVSDPGLRVGELASRMHLHISTTSNLVDKLITGGYLQRARSKRDQRVICLQPTAAAEALIGTATLPTRGLLPEVLSQMPEAELLQIQAALNQLLDRLPDNTPEAGFKPLPFTE